MMPVNDAIRAAKEWIRTAYAEEQISNLGLEEVVHDPDKGVWKITLGFSRPWDKVNNYQALATGSKMTDRALKVVNLNDTTGDLVSVFNRT